MLTIAPDQTVSPVRRNAERACRLCRCANALGKRELIAAWVAARRCEQPGSALREEEHYQHVLRGVDADVDALIDQQPMRVVSAAMLRAVQQLSLGALREYLVHRACVATALTDVRLGIYLAVAAKAAGG